MKLQVLSPRGYCHGVVRAIKLVEQAINNKDIPRPIYILGHLVHNEHITRRFNESNVITLDCKNKKRIDVLKNVKEGTIIFTAHGISKECIDLARTNNLHIIDASCPDVLKSQKIINDLVKENYVLYIGKENHPELEAAISISEKVIPIYSKECVDKFSLETNTSIKITNQTTMSRLDIEPLVKYIESKYINVEYLNEVCDATTKRQLAVLNQDKDNELCIVVGDKHSNNTFNLTKVSKSIGIESIRLDSVQDIETLELYKYKQISLTSGASTPTDITNEVIEYIKKID